MASIKRSTLGINLSPAALLEAYQCSEHENSNLRHTLFWAAQFLNPEQRKDLATRINEGIDDGGILGDSSEEEVVRLNNMYQKVDRMCDALEAVISTRKMPANTYRLQMTINEIREDLPKQQKPTLESLR